jgi:uncharacterized protein (DUF1501 family)
MGVATPLAINLAAIGEAAAFDNTDYKALVCVFLYGGNDYANTVVPYDAANYALYHQIRAGGPGEDQAGIALARASLAATALTPQGGQVLTDNLQYALAPQLAGLKQIWDAGRLAVQLNVGPLITPLTLAQYQSTNRVLYPLPPKLFSHNDQQSIWQANGSEGATIGWGGRLGDIALSSNTPNSLLTCISASGNAVFVAGHDALQYQISPGGAIRHQRAQRPAARRGDGTDHQDQQPRARKRVHHGHAPLHRDGRRGERRAGQRESRHVLSAAAIRSPTSSRSWRASSARGTRTACGRRCSSCSLGGFDNHNLLMDGHPGLLQRVNDAMSAFYAATVELGVADKVTTFTASDFGRTLSSNADGSDHGWGSHHFVMGGAVNGGRFYGTAPHVSMQSNDQVGQGRLLPSTVGGRIRRHAGALVRMLGFRAAGHPAQRGQLPEHQPRVR